MAAAKATAQPGADIVATTAFELIGVGLLALLAGTNDRVGNIIIIIMVGWLLIWAMAHTGLLQNTFGLDPAFKKVIG
jgi:hypothetical protein